jgi:hypothetical protein
LLSKILEFTKFSVSFNALDTKSFIFDFKLCVKLLVVILDEFNSIANTLDVNVKIANVLNPTIIPNVAGYKIS